MLLQVRPGFVIVPFEIAEANRSHVASLERGQLSVFLGIALLEPRRSAKVTNNAEIVVEPAQPAPKRSGENYPMPKRSVLPPCSSAPSK
jgi:hypothetical protein